ncbi:MAG: sodium/solute symporter, partial [Bacteroidota bacterium]
MIRKLLLLLFSLSPLLGVGQDTSFRIEWEELAPLIPSPESKAQPGLAGAFGGVIGESIFLAGGANFPNGPAWEGGEKIFHSDIYLLKDSIWKVLDIELPYPMAYGLSLSDKEALYWVGGMNGDSVCKAVFRVKLNQGTPNFQLESLPSLPLALANTSGGLSGTHLYVFGSREDLGESFLYTLDLSKEEEGWKRLANLPASPRTHAYGSIQRGADGAAFYLFKGRWKGAAEITQFLSDAWVYYPLLNEWKEIKQNKEFPMAAGGIQTLGANQILLLGGDSGENFNEIERFNNQISQYQGGLKDSLNAVRDSLMKYHPGFGSEIWSFHTITQSWHLLSTMPPSRALTTPVFFKGNNIILPSGEISPCIRTPQIWMGVLKEESSISILNIWVLVTYFMLLLGLGVYFSIRQKNTEDFFMAGRRIPAWAAGMSIFGTQLSAITFMAIPAKTFATNWLYVILNLCILLVAPFIIRIFLPFYRRFELRTAYEYLELRFNLATRLAGSLMYIFLQIGRLGIVLLLPSLALSVLTGVGVEWCILSMGILSILYTVLGGIEAVIWTDVLQVFVLLGGALLCFILLFFDMGYMEIMQLANDFDKFKMFDLNIDITEPTIWVLLFGGFAANFIQYGSDQTVIQRYLTTRDEKAAAKSIRIGAWMSLPATLIFFSLGTLLFVFFRIHPEAMQPTLESTDSIFPWYIVSQLPDGVSGLLLAGIFAASMSSLDSSMNSVSTVISVDFVERIFPLKQSANYLSLARILTVLIGALGTALAYVMASWGISSLWDQFNMIIGLFAGGLGGIFLAGILLPNVNGQAAMIALILSGMIQYVVKFYTDIHLLLYT